MGKLKISDDAIKTALITALDDPDLYVRCFAAWAIGQLRITDPQAVAKLRERLTNLRISKTSLEAQSVGVTLARMHTEARETPEAQLPLFGYPTGGQASKLPSTKQHSSMSYAAPRKPLLRTAQVSGSACAGMSRHLLG